MRRRLVSTLLVLLAAAPAAAGQPKPRRPRLEVRAAPRVALLAPARVLVTAELVGGEDVEDLYCPEIEWEWGDGSRSSHESDCPVFASGTQIERVFRNEHHYTGSGEYRVRVTLRRAERTVASAGATVVVDPSVRESSWR